MTAEFYALKGMLLGQIGNLIYFTILNDLIMWIVNNSIIFLNNKGK